MHRVRRAVNGYRYNRYRYNDPSTARRRATAVRFSFHISPLDTTVVARAVSRLRRGTVKALSRPCLSSCLSSLSTVPVEPVEADSS